MTLKHIFYICNDTLLSPMMWVTKALLRTTAVDLPAAGAALPPRLPGSCAHPHLLPPPPAAEVPGWWRRRYLAPQSCPALDSACCCCPPTADPGSFPKASLLPPGPSLGCLRRRRTWHSAKGTQKQGETIINSCLFLFSISYPEAKQKSK